MATDISGLRNKTENSGATAQGRLSATEFNRLVTACIESQEETALLKSGKVGYVSATTSGNVTTIRMYDTQNGTQLFTTQVAASGVYNALLTAIGEETSRAEEAEDELFDAVTGLADAIGDLQEGVGGKVGYISATTSGNVTTIRMYDEEGGTQLYSMQTAAANTYNVLYNMINTQVGALNGVLSELSGKALKVKAEAGVYWDVFARGTEHRIYLGVVHQYGDYYGVINDTGHDYIYRCNAAGTIIEGSYVTYGQGVWTVTSSPTPLSMMSALTVTLVEGYPEGTEMEKNDLLWVATDNALGIESMRGDLIWVKEVADGVPTDWDVLHTSMKNNIVTTKTRSEALTDSVSHPYRVYYPTDSTSIVMNGREYGVGGGSVDWSDIGGDPSDNADLQDALDEKVDKETGKGLSTNDYTNAEKTKLGKVLFSSMTVAEIEATQQTTPLVAKMREIHSALIGDSLVVLTPSITVISQSTGSYTKFAFIVNGYAYHVQITPSDTWTYEKKQIASTAAVTTSTDGLMSAADKTKLDGIETGANNFVLGKASSTQLGGVKVGDGLEMDSNGVLSTRRVLMTKTFTGVYYRNSTANWFFVNVKPAGTTSYWRIRYRVLVKIDSAPDYWNESMCEFAGYCGTIKCFAAWNSYGGSTWAMYNHCWALLKETGVTNDKANALGVTINSSCYKYNDSGYGRTVKIDVMDYEGCEVSFMDDATAYSGLDGTGSTNFNSSGSTYNATTAGITITGDRNNYNMFEVVVSRVYAAFAADTYPIGGLTADGKFLAISHKGSSGTGLSTARTYPTDIGMDWRQGLFYIADGTQRAAGYSAEGVHFHTAYNSVTLSYSDNCVKSTGSHHELGLTEKKDVYLRGRIGSDGLFYICPMEVTYNNITYMRAWTQDVPTEADGYFYWLVGRPVNVVASYENNGNAVCLYMDNKMYYHNGHELVEYAGDGGLALSNHYDLCASDDFGQSDWANIYKFLRNYEGFQKRVNFDNDIIEISKTNTDYCFIAGDCIYTLNVTASSGELNGKRIISDIASQSVLGGIKIGRGLSIDENGVVSVDAQGMNIWVGTHEQYEALEEKDPDTLYLETDSRATGYLGEFDYGDGQDVSGDGWADVHPTFDEWKALIDDINTRKLPVSFDTTDGERMRAKYIEYNENSRQVEFGGVDYNYAEGGFVQFTYRLTFTSAGGPDTTNCKCVAWIDM